MYRIGSLILPNIDIGIGFKKIYIGRALRLTLYCCYIVADSLGFLLKRHYNLFFAIVQIIWR